jgi:hypothetical protein
LRISDVKIDEMKTRKGIIYDRITNKVTILAKRKREALYGNNGMMEYWNEVYNYPLTPNIPLFQYSNIPGVTFFLSALQGLSPE